MARTASGLRSSLASCTATVIAMRAATLGVTLSTLEVTVESESDNRGILGLDDKVREIVDWGDAHSPVACTLRQLPACSVEIDVV